MIFSTQAAMLRSRSFGMGPAEAVSVPKPPLQRAKSDSYTPLRVQNELRWGCDRDIAMHVCNDPTKNESKEYWRQTTFSTFINSNASLMTKNKPQSFRIVSFVKKIWRPKKTVDMTFYDSVTGKPLFVAPRGRDLEQFKESVIANGWLVFNEEEVFWQNVECINDSIIKSKDGTYLGRKVPHGAIVPGNKYYGGLYKINLVSIAGRPGVSS